MHCIGLCPSTSLADYALCSAASVGLVGLSFLWTDLHLKRKLAVLPILIYLSYVVVEFFVL